MRARNLRLAVALALTLPMWACGAVPRDSHGALDRIRGGVLRAAVVEHPPWTVVDGRAVSGTEAQLLDAWASQLGARVEWRPGALDELVEALHRREVDVLAAGLHQNTPYAPRLALTQPYAETKDAHGTTQRLVLAVTPGESALLFNLDQFLAARGRGTQP